MEKFLDSFDEITRPSVLREMKHDLGEEDPINIAPAYLASKKGRYSDPTYIASGSYGSVFSYRNPANENYPRVTLKVTRRDPWDPLDDSECFPDSYYFVNCVNFIKQRCITPRKGIYYVDGRYYHCFVMEPVDTTVNTVVHKLSSDAAWKMVASIHHAFMCLLAQDKYYTDLKPANIGVIFRDRAAARKRVLDDADFTVKLLDLGSICAIGADHLATFPPPFTWSYFGGRGEPSEVECTERTAVWEIIVFTLDVYRVDTAPLEHYNLPNETRGEALAFFASTYDTLVKRNFDLAQIVRYFDLLQEGIMPRTSEFPLATILATSAATAPSPSPAAPEALLQLARSARRRRSVSRSVPKRRRSPSPSKRRSRSPSKRRSRSPSKRRSRSPSKRRSPSPSKRRRSRSPPKRRRSRSPSKRRSRSPPPKRRRSRSPPKRRRSPLECPFSPPLRSPKRNSRPPLASAKPAEASKARQKSRWLPWPSPGPQFYENLGEFRHQHATPP